MSVNYIIFHSCQSYKKQIVDIKAFKSYKILFCHELLTLRLKPPTKDIQDIKF